MPEIILMHGDKDEVVPVNHLLEAKDFFNKMTIKFRRKYSKIVSIEYRRKRQVWA